MQDENKEIPPAMVRLAGNRQRAMEKYHKGFLVMLGCLPLLDDDTFWRLCGIYRDCIDHFLFVHKRTDGVKCGADEFFHTTLTGRSYDMDDLALRFARTYDSIRARLAKGLDKTSNRSSDRFGDLCDALPVAAGRDVCEATMRGDYKDEAVLMRAVEKANSKRWRGFANGEHYCNMTLNERAERAYASYAAGYMLREREAAAALREFQTSTEALKRAKQAAYAARCRYNEVVLRGGV